MWKRKQKAFETSPPAASQSIQTARVGRGADHTAAAELEKKRRGGEGRQRRQKKKGWEGRRNTVCCGVYVCVRD